MGNTTNKTTQDIREYKIYLLIVFYARVFALEDKTLMSKHNMESQTKCGETISKNYAPNNLNSESISAYIGHYSQAIFQNTRNRKGRNNLGNARLLKYAVFWDQYTITELSNIVEQVCEEKNPDSTEVKELKELENYMSKPEIQSLQWQEEYRHMLTPKGKSDLSHLFNTVPTNSHPINSDKSEKEISDYFPSDNIEKNQEDSAQFITGGKNLLIYGAPGTGKSFYVDEILTKNIKYKRRVVFHPEYTYFDFIGSYKPVPVYEKTSNKYNSAAGIALNNIPGTPYIDYKFIAGPFIKSILDAYKHPSEKCCLIIEELNRANAAAVFGDIFQLLDRDDNGESKYAIEPSEELQDYLMKNGLSEQQASNLRIPKNLFIYATMNSADQGVNYLDSAFKRRWNYEYLRINYNEINPNSYILYDSVEYYYASFIENLNNKLRESSIEEDRLIGPWYINTFNQELNHIDPNAPQDTEKEKEIQDAAVKKLLLYLWDDIFRYKHGSECLNASSLEELISGFSERNVLNLEVKSIKTIKAQNADGDNN